MDQQGILLSHGDVVVFSTDCITESMDAYGELFDDDRLREIIFTHNHCNANEIIQEIVKGICDFVEDTPQSDDMTLFVVKRL